jgi:hypothetical protein
MLAALFTIAVAMPCVAAAAAGAVPRVEAVSAGRDGELLTCRVRTASLPGERISSTIRSGLPSAIELALEVLDAREHVIAENHVSFRMAFDLWEEIFRIQGAGEERDFGDLAGLAAYLAEPPQLPVAPLSLLAAGERFRIRVALVLHPVAPRETARLSEWVAGTGPAETERAAGTDRAAGSPDGRETLLDLGKVIGFFYRGSRRSPGSAAEAMSDWFLCEELEAFAARPGESAS